jgi:hypothetical protein
MSFRNRNSWEVYILLKAAIIAFSLAMPISYALAEPYDITDYASGTFTIHSESKDLTIMSFEYRGISRANHENRAFDNCTLFYVGVAQMTPQKTTAHGYTKYLDPDGDYVIMESIREGSETTMTILQGTGKWKGIRGGGKLRRIASGKPIAPGTSQICARHTGTFELPKK